MAAGSATQPTRGEGLGWLAAWGVHVFTASGAVIGTAALLAIQAGALRDAALWMLAALAVDSVDGAFARRARVAERVPAIDGRRLDDIVDYLNYVIVPAVFLVAAGRLAHPAWCALPVLASAFGFAKRRAKTEDDFFLGFPSYWNVVALYLWGLELPAGLATGVVVAFAVAVLVPWKYIYPSRMRVLRRSTSAVAALWWAVLGLAIALPELAERLHLLELSLAFPIYYGILSAWLGGFDRPTPRSPEAEARVPGRPGPERTEGGPP